MKPILHLNVKRQWFDMIESGIKKEEYRVQSSYWSRILMNHIRIKGLSYHPTDVILCFSNGYSPNRDQIFTKCNGLYLGYGNPAWGALKDVQYFIIKIGDKLVKEMEEWDDFKK